MPFKDKEKHREFQRNWLRSRRSEFFAGKSCVQCGSTERLELDHIDPLQKVSHRIWSWSAERRTQETSKCQVLCRYCHMEKSKNEKHIRRAA